MKCIVSAVALLFALIWAAAHSAVAQTQPAWGAPNPRIEIAYVEPRDAGLRPFYDRLKKRQVLEILQGFLAPLRLPRTIAVKTDQCGTGGVHYTPGGAVTICYEYVASLDRAAPDVRLQIGGQAFTREDALVGAFVHVALHETARVVFDVLEIPVWGREEHAADRVAGFLMFQFGEKVAYRTLVGTSWFLAQSAAVRTGLPTGDFGQTRTLDPLTMQRFYNALCIALGGDEARFAFVKQSLPKDRAENCRWEYLQLARSFNATFMPHVDPELMKKVQATDWLKPADRN
jgi:Putative metallopeptidase